MHDTAKRFGWPASVIHGGTHWTVLLRPQQATLGALVLCANSPVLRYSELPAAAFAEQGELVVRIENALRRFVNYDRINWLMLMMVDPQVHFHVIPRYASPREFEGISFVDGGWPALPQLGGGIASDESLRDRLIRTIRSHWE
jgi:diadenosine tetraphosphate (Ap4A) HIT family hydrolase